MLAGATGSDRFVYQTSPDTATVKAYDGTASVGVNRFTSNTDITTVMSYLQGGALNILADGSTEATASLTGDLYTPTLSIGSIAGAECMLGTIESITYYPTQLTLAERQAIT